MVPQPTLPRVVHRVSAGLLALLLLGGWPATGASADAAPVEPVHIKVAGGLAGVAQYTRFEEPFWQTRIRELSGGRIEATVRPFDKSGLRAQDMLQLMRLGVVPWGTVSPSIAAADEPELNAIDLPALNPDILSLRRTAAAYRPQLGRILGERYGIELLGIYAYPAQVIYCKDAFDGLGGLEGRRVRTSSVAQSEFVEGLGGVGVIVPFGEIMAAVRDGVVDCAITGTLSGNEIGLSDATTHVHGMAVSWGVTVFGANRTAWASLSPELQAVVRRGVSELEADIWRHADHETARGLACNTGVAESCGDGRLSAMTPVPASAADESLRRELLVGTVLPRWIGRCGQACVKSWNAVLAPVTGLSLASH